MTPLSEEAKELLRDAILMQLNSARNDQKNIGRRIDSLHVGVKLAGFQTLEKTELAKQLRYLESHGMIEREDKQISKSVDIYMITQAGIAYLDEQGLA